MVLFSEDPIRLLQGFSSPWLDAFFAAVTQLGDRMVLFGLAILLYWLWDRRIGFFVLATLLASAAVNGVAKESIGLERPPESLWKRAASGPGFPSGHAQQTTAFAGSWTARLGRRWIGPAIALVGLVSLSRVYLGVHFVGDVVGGVAMGLLVVLLAIALARQTSWSRLGLRARVLLALLAPTAIQAVLYAGFGQSETSLGLLSGASLGYVVEEAWIRLARPSGWPAVAVRVVVGGGILGTLELVRDTFASGASEYGLLALMGFVATFALPWAFVQVERRIPQPRGSTREA
jgi:glycerophosphoryl diester phosphodiesterase